MKNIQKHLFLVGIILVVSFAVYFLFPSANNFLIKIRTHSYLYGYSMKNLVIGNKDQKYTEESVPILMYHGVVTERATLGTNTQRSVFIKQMEMLKAEGYNTISIAEYDLFRKGKFNLPNKPIILTFDDGRKDSYYTVDEVLKKLGFKGTLFVASIKANNNDPFYLNWSELKKIQETGRWEIEAHGRKSHEQVVIDANGSTGSFLTSRIYYPGKGLESIDEFNKRVEQDYLDNLSDLKKNLNIDARYYAVPLNDYGADEGSNYPESYEFNKKITKKYFSLAFVQSYHNPDKLPAETFYNYKDSNPMTLKRLSVENMDSELLKKSLNKFAPSIPSINYTNQAEVGNITNTSDVLFGMLNTENQVSLSSSKQVPFARMILGNRGWKNYSVDAILTREKGVSVSIDVYYLNEENFVELDWSENSLKLTERVNGNTSVLATYYPLPKSKQGEVVIRVYEGTLDAYFNEIVLAKDIKINAPRGAIGVGVWDQEGAKSIIDKFVVTNLNSKPSQLYPDKNFLVKNEEIVVDKEIKETTTEPVTAPVHIVKEINLLDVSGNKNTFEIASFNSFNGWESLYGTLFIKDSELHVGADASNTSSVLFFEPGSSWVDYIHSVQVDWFRGTSFGLISRFKDSGNYIECVFSNYGKTVSMFKVVNGVSTDLGNSPDLPIPFHAPWINRNYKIVSKGNHFECIVEDDVVLTYDIDDAPTKGTIGYETWDKAIHNTDVSIKKIIVEPILK